MSLHAPTQRRERILLYGRSNSGKSSSWLSIANWLSRSSSPGRLYVGDTDNAWDAMRPEDGSLDSVVKVTDLDINDYRGWITWVRGVKGRANPDDWVVVDMIDKAWLGSQTYYWEQVQGDDMLADIYMRNQVATQAAMKKEKYDKDDLMGGAHGANWGVINKYYGSFFQPLTSMKCNVLCVAPASELRDDSNADDLAQYKVRYKPQGQKDLVYGFHTVLFSAETPRGWIYTTIRERKPLGTEGREILKGSEVDGFVETYLLGVAGWKL